MRIKVLSGGRKNIELSLSDAELNFQMRRIGIEETVGLWKCQRRTIPCTGLKVRP